MTAATGSLAAGLAGAGLPSAKPDRDPRVDFFRGLALIFIFIDHIPENLFALVTLRNFGFSDAAEVFIFLSGYSAGYVFWLRRQRRGFLFASAELLRRVWTLYVVHIFVFVLFVAQVSVTAARFSNPLFAEEMNMMEFLEEPQVAVVQALLLQFQPRFLDILPLYIVLLLTLPALLAVPVGREFWALVPLGLLYLGVQVFDLHLVAYPNDRYWTFNPMAWQLLFVIGAYIGRSVIMGVPVLPPRRWVFWPAVAFLLFGLVVGLSWAIAGKWPSFPALLDDELWPIDKPDLSPWRLFHFLALAYVVVVLTQERTRVFNRMWAQPLVACGRHSLHLFCLGIFLSVFGEVITARYGYAFLSQVVVNVGGCAVLIGTARMLDWYRRLQKGAVAT